MNFTESAPASAATGAAISSGSGVSDALEAHGVYTVSCVGADGVEKWSDTIDNVVTYVGRNLLLDTGFGGSAYTANVYMGLISSVSYGAGPVIGDTMASHAGWYECSATTYFPTVAARLAPSWTAAAAGSSVSNKATNTVAFSIITNAGTVQGCFIVMGTGAVATLGNTSGTLYSAGVFTGGAKVVAVSDTLNVTYTATI